MAADRYPAFWRHDGVGARVLRPLEWLFRQVVGYRQRHAEDMAQWVGAPVVVVGNLSVGGTGKTPLVIWLVQAAAEMGFQPGVVLRGHRGSATAITPVAPDSDPREKGDEAVLLAQRTQRPVMIGRDRVAAASTLLETTTVDLVISDDGLQHYALGRDVEIAVIDAARGHGNGRCLPAGPLREPVERLRAVDLVLGNGAPVPDGSGMFEITPGTLQALAEPAASRRRPPMPGARVHAVAGLGNPDRFFTTLASLGFDVQPHPLGDHHRFHAGDLQFDDTAPVIMTEKDAVKCWSIAPANSWYLPVHARPDAPTAARLRDLLGLARQRFADRQANS